MDPASPGLPKARSRQEHNCSTRQHPSGRACPEGLAGVWVQAHPGCHCPSRGPAVSLSAGAACHARAVAAIRGAKGNTQRVKTDT